MDALPSSKIRDSTTELLTKDRTWIRTKRKKQYITMVESE